MAFRLNTAQLPTRTSRTPLDVLSTQVIAVFWPKRTSTSAFRIIPIKHKDYHLLGMKSLIGLLNFACAVVQPGRAFLRRLIDLTICIRSGHHLIRLSGEAKADLRLWLAFLSHFNGKSFFLHDEWFNSHKLNLFTDASGALGFGALFGNHWCYGRWPNEWAYKNIAILEFYPIVLSLFLWGHEMQNRCILFFTDNEALVHGQACPRVTQWLSRRFISLSGSDFSRTGAIFYGHIADRHSSTLAAPELAAIVTHLINSSLQPSSLPTYKRAWKLFYDFFHTTFPGVTVNFPILAPHLALFIAYLFDRNYAASTANTYISALSYSHKLLGHPDPTKVFFIIQMLKGYDKLGSSVYGRLPITLPILHKVCILLQISPCPVTSCACFGQCAPLLFMLSCVWAKW